MLEFIEAVLDWQKLVDTGFDTVAYFFMAAVGTLLFLIRLAFALFFGGDSGDGDFDTAMDDGGSDAAFTFFSLLSILAFFMGAGWMGLAARFDFDLSPPVSAFVAAGFGFGMMTLASGLMYMTKRLNRQIDYDVETAVGRTGRAYVNIPEKGSGHGQVQVTVSGRRKILRARSSGPAIAAFSDVVIESAMDDETLVVKPLGEGD